MTFENGLLIMVIWAIFLLLPYYYGDNFA